MAEHYALTRDEINVAAWTGEVPRVGETLYVYGTTAAEHRGRWTVTEVTWLVRATTFGEPCAELRVRPQDAAAKKWLLAARARQAEPAVPAP